MKGENPRDRENRIRQFEDFFNVSGLGTHRTIWWSSARRSAASRPGWLEDRVFRIRTGKSAACTPMPRTLHQISNVRIALLEDDRLEVKANWHTLYHRLGNSEQFYGHATNHLRAEGDDWRILRKHVLLLNDTNPPRV